MQITLSNLALTWATAPYFYLAIYGVANVIVIRYVTTGRSAAGY